MGELKIRDAVDTDVDSIHRILVEAFLPYRGYYTDDAFNITVCAPEVLKQRIVDEQTRVLVAAYREEIVGTATMYVQEDDRLYISSMAVRPTIQGRGGGYYLLSEIERRARDKNCSVISLECCEFLKMAIGLYKRMGYERTGRTRNYYGVEVFEMQKRL